MNALTLKIIPELTQISELCISSERLMHLAPLLNSDIQNWDDFGQKHVLFSLIFKNLISLRVEASFDILVTLLELAFP